MREILFRCDASSKIGTGHFRRCLVLGEEIKKLGGTVFFILKIDGFEVPETLLSVADDWKILDWNLDKGSDARAIISIYKERNACAAVIDHYGADTAYQKQLYDANLRWMQFDGCAQQPIWAKWVINPSLSSHTCDYESVLQRKDTRLFLGPEFAFLRPEFNKWKSRAEFRKSVEKILLTFGGGDDRGAIVFCLESIKHLSPDIERLILTTGDNPGKDNILHWLKKNPINARLILDETEIARRIVESDLGITAGGMTTFETAAMGLPCLIVHIADNQIRNAEAWHEAGVSINLGSLDELKHEDLYRHVKHLIENPEKRMTMHKLGMPLVDGRGVERVARVLSGKNDGQRE